MFWEALRWACTEEDTLKFNKSMLFFQWGGCQPQMWSATTSQIVNHVTDLPSRRRSAFQNCTFQFEKLKNDIWQLCQKVKTSLLSCSGLRMYEYNPTSNFRATIINNPRWYKKAPGNAHWTLTTKQRRRALSCFKHSDIQKQSKFGTYCVVGQL